MSKNNELLPSVMQCYFVSLMLDDGITRVFHYKPLGQPISAMEVCKIELDGMHFYKSTKVTVLSVCRLADVPLKNVPDNVKAHYFPEHFSHEDAKEAGNDVQNDG